MVVIIHLAIAIIQLLLSLGINLAQTYVHIALVGIIIIVKIIDKLLAVVGLRVVFQALGHNSKQLFTRHQLTYTYRHDCHQI